MANFKVRIGNGSAPYNGAARNYLDNVVFNIVNVMDDEIEIPDSVMNSLVGGIKITVTDSSGKTGTVNYDNGTLAAKKRTLIGFSVSNGSPQDHVQKIQEGNDNGFSYTGVIMEASEIKTDADLFALENSGVFNASAPLPANPVFHLDRTIWHMMQQPVCNMIRLNIWWQRNADRANNGTTRTKFITFADSMMRPDGVTPIVRQTPGGGLFDLIIPSYASENTFQYAARITVAIFKRYLPYINSGNIIAIGSVFTTNGEGEILFNHKVGLTDENYNDNIRANGDFHPDSLAKFKQRFPEYANLDGNAIYNASLQSPLGVRWSWHNNQLIIDFEKRLAKYVVDNVPGLTRTKFVQIDSGSFLDELAFYRKTLNVEERASNPYVMLFKSNDNSDEPAEKVDFYLDQISSLARKTGAVAIVEPSPSQPWEAPEHYGYILTELKKADERGVGISYYTPNKGLSDQLTKEAGIIPGSIPKNKKEFKIVNGHKKLLRHSIDLSNVLANGGFGGSGAWMNSWLSFRNSNGLQSVDTHTFDNVKPSEVGGELPPPTSPPQGGISAFGVKSTTVGNKYIGVINGQDLIATVNPTTGAVRIIYDEFRTARQGNKQTKGWLLNGHLSEIKPTELSQLRSTQGLILPDGDYHFYLYYAATDLVTNFADLRTHIYSLFLDPQTWPTNSREMEELIIEVKTINV